jgi:hypothetical protein
MQKICSENRDHYSSGTVTDGKRGEPEPFQQIWFAGNHSDIGGSYPDNESRLSDITLKWMADFIEYELPAEARVHVDRSVLRYSPSSAGMMHDQCMVGMAGTPLHWYPADRDCRRRRYCTTRSMSV